MIRFISILLLSLLLVISSVAAQDTMCTLSNRLAFSTQSTDPTTPTFLKYVDFDGTIHSTETLGPVWGTQWHNGSIVFDQLYKGRTNLWQWDLSDNSTFQITTGEMEPGYSHTSGAGPLFYIEDPDGTPRAIKMDLSTYTTEEYVPVTADGFSFSFSNDGKVTYLSGDVNRPTLHLQDGTRDLAKQLAYLGQVQNPIISPDGNNIAVLTDKLTYQELGVINVGGNRIITYFPGYIKNPRIFGWSADSKTLLIGGDYGEQGSTVYFYDSTLHLYTQTLNSPDYISTALLSPTGDALAVGVSFFSYEEDVIFVYHIYTREICRAIGQGSYMSWDTLVSPEYHPFDIGASPL